jgi:hypothetical protein
MTSYIHIASRSEPWKPKETKKLIPIRCHISKILSTSMHDSFVRYRSSEFSPSLESLWNSLRLWYSEFPGSCFDYAQILKLRSYGSNQKFQPQQVLEIITPELLVGLRLMGKPLESWKSWLRCWYWRFSKIAFEMESNSQISQHAVMFIISP